LKPPSTCPEDQVLLPALPAFTSDWSGFPQQQQFSGCGQPLPMLTSTSPFQE
jgi:hypothetical protein